MKLRLWNPDNEAEVELPVDFEVEMVRELPLVQPAILVVPVQFECRYAHLSLAESEKTGDIPQYAVLYGIPVKLDRRVFDDVIPIGDFEALRDAIACDHVRDSEALVLIPRLEQYARLVADGKMQNSPGNLKSILLGFFNFPDAEIDAETREFIQHVLDCEICFGRLRDRVPEIGQIVSQVRQAADAGSL